MELNNLNIRLIRDPKPERFVIPANVSFKFKPFLDNVRWEYRTIDLVKQDPMCYVKHKKHDLWLYEVNGKPKLLPPQRTETGFTTYKQPLVLFIDYLDKPSFVMYDKGRFGQTPKMRRYLRYGEEDGKIFMDWTNNPSSASLFFYSDYNRTDWDDLINQNIPARISFTKESAYKKTPYKTS